MKKMFGVSATTREFIQFYDDVGKIGKPVPAGEDFSWKNMPKEATRFRRFKMSFAELIIDGEIDRLKSRKPRWLEKGFYYPGAKYAKLEELENGKESPSFRGGLREKLKADPDLHLVKTRTDSFTLIGPADQIV